MGEQAPKAERLMVGHGQVQPRLQDGVSHAAARVPEAHPLRPASRGSGSWRDTPSQSPPTGDFPGGPVVKTLPSNAGGVGSIPGWGARIPQASRPKSKSIKQKQYCNKFNKDFKTGPHQQIIKRKITSCRGCCSGLETPQALQVNDSTGRIQTQHDGASRICREMQVRCHLWAWHWERPRICHRSHERSRRKFRPLLKLQQKPQRPLHMGKSPVFSDPSNSPSFTYLINLFRFFFFFLTT